MSLRTITLCANQDEYNALPRYEGEGFPAPGLRHADDVAARHQRWNGLHLDGKRPLDIAALEHADDLVGEPALQEGLDGPRAMLSTHLAIHQPHPVFRLIHQWVSFVHNIMWKDLNS